jgi:RNA polymerase sigma-70 factor (ECF subfamily)
VRLAERVLGDREEAEDVAQETLLRAGDAVLRDPAALPGWLSAVCSRLAIDRLRARRRRQRLHDAAPARRGVDLFGDAATRDEARRAREALAALDDPYRTAVTLRYLEGLEFRELARRMNTLERTARTWVGRGLTRLRARLGAAR